MKSTADTDAMIDLLMDLDRRGVELVADGDRLRYRPLAAVTPALAERLRTHKIALLAVLRPVQATSEAASAQPDDHPNQVEGGRTHDHDRPNDSADQVIYIDPPNPCPKCGSLMLWWNILGDQRCMVCDPPTKARKAMEQAARIRQRHAAFLGGVYDE